MNSLGAPNWLFEIVLGVVNWAMLFAFVLIVTRATDATTRRAQAPAIRARRRALAIPAPTAAAGQLPERASASTAGSTQQ